MTVAEILEQAKALTPQERKELIKVLIDTLDISEAPKSLSDVSQEHWGKALNRLMDELGPIEMVHPEIEDATEWVKQIRHEQTERLKPYWDGEK